MYKRLTKAQIKVVADVLGLPINERLTLCLHYQHLSQLPRYGNTHTRFGYSSCSAFCYRSGLVRSCGQYLGLTRPWACYNKPSRIYGCTTQPQIFVLEGFYEDLARQNTVAHPVPALATRRVNWHPDARSWYFGCLTYSSTRSQNFYHLKLHIMIE
jgi:hypothetical protein